MTISTTHLSLLLNLSIKEKELLKQITELNNFLHTRIGLEILYDLQIGVYDTYDEKNILVRTFWLDEDGFRKAIEFAKELHYVNLDKEARDYEFHSLSEDVTQEELEAIKDSLGL